jgi:hypothetical protein
LLDTERRQVAAETTSRQHAEQQLHDAAQQSLQLQRSLDAKVQQLREQSQSHTEELQVRTVNLYTVNI